MKNFKDSQKDKLFIGLLINLEGLQIVSNLNRSKPRQNILKLVKQLDLGHVPLKKNQFIPIEKWKEKVMGNIAIIETNENMAEFLSNMQLKNDIKVWTYEDVLFKTAEFILSENSILVIEQYEELKDIEFSTLNYFSMNNTVFILTFNCSLMHRRYKKEYSLLKKSIGLIYEGNTITKFVTIYNSSS